MSRLAAMVQSVQGSSHHTTKKSELRIPSVPEALLVLDTSPLRTLLESLVGVSSALDSRVIDTAQKSACLDQTVKSLAGDLKEKESAIYSSLWAADRGQTSRADELEARLDEISSKLKGFSEDSLRELTSHVFRNEARLEDMERAMKEQEARAEAAAAAQRTEKEEHLDHQRQLEERLVEMRSSIGEDLNVLREELKKMLGVASGTLAQRMEVAESDIESLHEDMQQLSAAVADAAASAAASGLAAGAASSLPESIPEAEVVVAHQNSDVTVVVSERLTVPGRPTSAALERPTSPEPVGLDRQLSGRSEGVDAMVTALTAATAASQGPSRPRSPAALPRMSDLLAWKQEIKDDIQRVRSELEDRLAKSGRRQADLSAGELWQAVSEMQARLQNSNPGVLEVNFSRLRVQVSGIEGDLGGVKKSLAQIQGYLSQQNFAAGVSHCISCYGARSPSPESQRCMARDGKTFFVEPPGPEQVAEPGPETARSRRARPTTACGLPAAALPSASPSIPGIASRGGKREEAALSPFDLYVQRGKDRRPELHVARSAGGSHSRPSTPGTGLRGGSGKAHRDAVLVRQEQLQADYLQRAAADFGALAT